MKKTIQIILLAVIACLLALVLIRNTHPKPEPPINVTYARAILGSGYVVTFQNKSQKSLSVTTQFSREGQNPKTFSFVLDYSKQIGHLEGWAAASGDKIAIWCPGYSTTYKNIP